MVSLKEFVSVCLLIVFVLAFTSARKEKGNIGNILVHDMYSTDRMCILIHFPLWLMRPAVKYITLPFFLCKEC